MVLGSDGTFVFGCLEPVSKVHFSIPSCIRPPPAPTGTPLIAPISEAAADTPF